MNEDRRLDDLIAALRGSKWTAQIFSGGLPKTPTRDVLPAPSADFAYARVVVPGAPDIEYVCLRDAAGDWEWAVSATGTP